MRTEYYSVLYSALREGDIERRTSTDGSSVELIRNGETLYSDSGKPLEEYRSEFIKTEPRIVVFGAGHVSKALYEQARLLNMSFTVIDERKETANKERFPQAEIILRPYEEFFSSDYTFFRPYYVIMTHGHSYDSRALEWVLRRPASYIGMIGSRGKVASTYRKMLDKGYTEAELSFVHSPVGLKIGAVTPEEIAVSILAEIISVFRSVKGAFTISPSYIESVTGKKGVCARIIEKTGSAPRSVGSELFYSPLDDRFYGTVGGGAVEKAAEESCREMWKKKEKCRIIHYNLSAEGDLSMICGGDVDMLFSLVE